MARNQEKPALASSNHGGWLITIDAHKAKLLDQRMLVLRLVLGHNSHHLKFRITACSFSLMASLLPPPKRQKVYHGIPEPEPEPPKPTPHVVVQFVSDENGEPLAPVVNLPANVSREGLEVLVNKLNTKVGISRVKLVSKSYICNCQDDEPVPFAFHIALPQDASATGQPTQIVISKSIQEDVLSHPSNSFTPEDVFVIRCSPQAVFRVRPATRCSSTLSGIFHWVLNAHSLIDMLC